MRPGDTTQTVHSPSESGWVQPFDVPVVRVALSLSIGHNGGPLNLIFGPFLGSPTKDIFAKGGDTYEHDMAERHLPDPFEGNVAGTATDESNTGLSGGINIA